MGYPYGRFTLVRAEVQFVESRRPPPSSAVVLLH